MIAESKCIFSIISKIINLRTMKRFLPGVYQCCTHDSFVDNYGQWLLMLVLLHFYSGTGCSVNQQRRSAQVIETTVFDRVIIFYMELRIPCYYQNMERNFISTYNEMNISQTTVYTEKINTKKEKNLLMLVLWSYTHITKQCDHIHI